MRANPVLPLVSLLFLLLGPSVARAQAPCLERTLLSPLTKEIGLYYAYTVDPILRAQRAKLDQELSPPDKELLARYNAQAGKLYADFAPLQRSGLVTRDRNHPARQRHRQQLRALRNPADSLARKYAGAIQRVLQELAPQRTQWAADIQAIEQQYPPAMAAYPGRDHLRLLAMKFDPVVFLLLQPARPRPAIPANAN
ncbi:hypothetical protein ACW9KT_21760 [Hymenobacter sp. HD11105]